MLLELGGLELGVEVSSLVLYFVVRNFVQGASASAVDRKLAGLAFWFKLQGVGDFTKSFAVRQAMKGYHRGRSTRDARRPVSISVLRAVLEQLRSICSSEYEQKLFQAAFLLPFFGALRIGELVSPSKKGSWGGFMGGCSID